MASQLGDRHTVKLQNTFAKTFSSHKHDIYIYIDMYINDKVPISVFSSP